MLACFISSDSEECAKKNTKWGCVCMPGTTYTIVQILLGTRITLLSYRGFVANVSVRAESRDESKKGK